MFGVTLWEMVAREEPFKNEAPVPSAMRVCAGERLVIPDTCPKPLKELIKHCWKHEPKERPSIKEVFSRLKQMLKELKENEKSTGDEKKEEGHVVVMETNSTHTHTHTSSSLPALMLKQAPLPFTKIRSSTTRTRAQTDTHTHTHTQTSSNNTHTHTHNQHNPPKRSVSDTTNTTTSKPMPLFVIKSNNNNNNKTVHADKASSASASRSVTVAVINKDKNEYNTSSSYVDNNINNKRAQHTVHTLQRKVCALFQKGSVWIGEIKFGNECSSYTITINTCTPIEKDVCRLYGVHSSFDQSSAIMGKVSLCDDYHARGVCVCMCVYDDMYCTYSSVVDVDEGVMSGRVNSKQGMQFDSFQTGEFMLRRRNNDFNHTNDNNNNNTKNTTATSATTSSSKLNTIQCPQIP